MIEWCTGEEAAEQTGPHHRRDRPRRRHRPCDAAYFGWQLLVAKPESPPGPGTNEVQRIVFNGGPNGGSLTLSFDGEGTAPLPYHPSATQRQNALTALPNTGFGYCWSPRRQGDPAVDFGVRGHSSRARSTPPQHN